MTEKCQNMCRLNSTLLNDTRVKEEIKYFEWNENGNTTYQKFWDAVKAVFRGKFISLNLYIRKEERYKIDYLGFHLRKLQKEEQIEVNPK